MKILVVHNEGVSQLPSGELLAAKGEAQALRDQEHDVRFETVSSATIRTMSPIKKSLAAGNLLWSRSSSRQIGALLDDFSPDVVHFHSILPVVTPSAFYACKKRSVPVVQTLHNFRWLCVEGGLFRNDTFCNDCIEKSSVRGIYHRCSRGSMALSALLTVFNAVYVKTGLLFKLVDRFIAVSNFVRDTYVAGGFPSAKIHVRYNGIRLPPMLYPTQERVGVAFVGRLTKGKGTENLKLIMKEMRDVPFSIVGEGPERISLERFAEENRLTNATFLGWLQPDDVNKVIRSVSCVVVPSVSGETFGRVVLEALALETPVVVSRIGGLAELAEMNSGVVAVDPQYPDRFVSEIENIVNSQEIVASMGSSGREFVSQHVSVDQSTKELLAIYTEVIERGSSDQ